MVRAPGDPAPPAELAAVEAFLAAALRSEAPIADDPALTEIARVHVAGNDRVSPEEQADIYREQFWLRHHACLAEDYPGLRAVVGEEVFAALVRAYLAAHPPRTPSLRDLGADLLPFAEGWTGFPADEREPAIEMLRYEQCFIDLFDGADVRPLDAARLQAIPEDGWERARITLHPLLRRLHLRWPVHLYRLAVAGLGDDALHAADSATRAPGAAAPGHSEGAPPVPPFPAEQAVSLVLYRKGLVIQYDEVDPEALALLDALAAGEPLGAACERVAASLDAAAAEALGARVGPWFQDWTAKRWIVDVTI